MAGGCSFGCFSFERSIAIRPIHVILVNSRVNSFVGLAGIVGAILLLDLGSWLSSSDGSLARIVRIF